MEKDTDFCWREEPLVMIFESVETLEEFCSESSKLQAKLLNENFYNSVTSHIRFYQEYKSGDTPMPEFYHNHVTVHHPDSHCCVGNALIMRKGLLDPESYFIQQYPDLEQYLYYATSNIMAYSSMDKIPNHRECWPAMDSAPYKEHVLVALKISLNDRYGYVFMDIGYHMSFPVIVMADGNPPHTQPFSQFWKRGQVEQSFKLQGNYIHWIERDVNDDSVPPCNRWIYVAKKFTKLLQMEKRNRVSFFHAMMTRGLSGPEAGIFSVFGKDKGINIYMKATSDKEDNFSLSIPFDYLMSDQNENYEYEDAIGNCASMMKIDKMKLRKTMKNIAELVNDKPFFEEMLKLNDEYLEIIENSWKN